MREVQFEDLKVGDVFTYTYLVAYDAEKDDDRHEVLGVRGAVIDTKMTVAQNGHQDELGELDTFRLADHNRYWIEQPIGLARALADAKALVIGLENQIKEETERSKTYTLTLTAVEAEAVLRVLGRVTGNGELRAGASTFRQALLDAGLPHYDVHEARDILHGTLTFQK